MGPTKVSSEGGSSSSASAPISGVSNSGVNNPPPKTPKASQPGKGKGKLSGGVVIQNPESIELQRRKLQSQLDRIKALKTAESTERYVDLRQNAALQQQKGKKVPPPPKKSAAVKANSGLNTQQKKMSIRKKMLERLKHPFQVQCRTVKLREALEKGFGSSPQQHRAGIYMRRQQAKRVALDGIMKLESSLNKKVSTFQKAARSNVRQLSSSFKSNMSKSQMVDGIIRDLENDKIFENKVAYAYLCAVLNPEKYKNIGIPDQYNGARSGKPTIVTEYIIPFDSNGEAAVVVSDDPLQHITVIKGGSASQVQIGPIWQNANETQGNSDTWTTIVGNLVTSARADSFLTAAQSCTFKVDAGKVRNLPLWFVEDSEIPVPLTEIQIDSKQYNYIACAAGDTFTVIGTTVDVTANGYTMTLQTVELNNGVYTIVPQGPTNATGVSGFVTTAFVLGANVVGVYSYNITNTLAGNDPTANVVVRALLTKSLGQITLPCGKANGDDVNFLIDYCDEYRSGPMSVKSTYYGGYLENGLIIQGQLPKDDDFELPPPSVQDWGLIPGVQTKPLNDPADPGAYTSVIPRNITSRVWETLSSESGDDSPSHEQVIIYLKANDTTAEFVRVRTCLQFAYHTEVQSVYTDEGVIDEEAMDLAMNWLLDMFNGMSPNFGNCDHDEKCDEILQKFEKERGGTSVSFFNGWFSGNDTKLSNDGEIIA